MTGRLQYRCTFAVFDALLVASGAARADVVAPLPKEPLGGPAASLPGAPVPPGIGFVVQNGRATALSELHTHDTSGILHIESAQDEPYTACLPMAPPPAVHPYPWRIVQSYTTKGMTHIFIIHENALKE